MVNSLGMESPARSLDAAAILAALTISPGDILLGKLRVVRLLGEGGMGMVFEVEHCLTKHHRALKVLRPEVATNAEVAARFIREAGVAGTIGSELVADVQDAGRLDDGSLYLLMELLDGETLRTYLAGRRRLSSAEAVGLCRQLCAGLMAAHDKGIVHRDLKPDNVFLTPGQDGSARIKLLDFGISKFDDLDSYTQSGTVVGTPLYMSPEQLRDAKRVSVQTDMYSLGVVAYEMLSGARPYDATNVTELIAKVLTEEHLPLSDRVPDIDPRLSMIVERCLRRDPNERFDSVAEVAQALSEIESTEIRFGRSESTSAPRGQQSQTAFASTLHSNLPPAASSKRPLLVGAGLVLLLVVSALVFATSRQQESAEPPSNGAPAMRHVDAQAAAMTSLEPPPEDPPPSIEPEALEESAPASASTAQDDAPMHSSMMSSARRQLSKSARDGISGML